MRPFFPKTLSCLFAHSLACGEVEEKYAAGHFLSRSASVSGDGYGAIHLQSGDNYSVTACSSLCIARELGWVV